MNKIVNINLKPLVIWLNVNKIPFFFKKTETVFKIQQKKFQGDKKVKPVVKSFILLKV